jgi:hypothetical protein
MPRSLVEQPEHGLFSPDGRGGGHPDVEVTTVDLHLELAVLGATTFDNVHVGHDLDAAHERRANVGRQREHLREGTIHAEPHSHDRVGRLDMHIRGTVAKCLGDDLVHHLHDRTVSTGRRRRKQIRVLRRRGESHLGAGECIKMTFDFNKHRVCGVHHGCDVGSRRNTQMHVQDGKFLEEADRFAVERVDHRHAQRDSVVLERQQAIPLCVSGLYPNGRGGRRGGRTEVGKWHVQQPRGGEGETALVDRAGIDELATQRPAVTDVIGNHPLNAGLVAGAGAHDGIGQGHGVEIRLARVGRNLGTGKLDDRA